MVKWSVELIEFRINFASGTTIMGQALDICIMESAGPHVEEVSLIKRFANEEETWEL